MSCTWKNFLPHFVKVLTTHSEALYNKTALILALSSSDATFPAQHSLPPFLFTCGTFLEGLEMSSTRGAHTQTVTGCHRCMWPRPPCRAQCRRYAFCLSNLSQEQLKLNWFRETNLCLSKNSVLFNWQKEKKLRNKPNLPATYLLLKMPVLEPIENMMNKPPFTLQRRNIRGRQRVREKDQASKQPCSSSLTFSLTESPQAGPYSGPKHEGMCLKLLSSSCTWL